MVLNTAAAYYIWLKVFSFRVTVGSHLKSRIEQIEQN